MSSPAEFLDTRTAPPAAAFDRFLRRRTLQALDAMRGGQVRLREGDDDILLGTADGDDPLHIVLRVRNPAFWRQLASNGSVGAGESFMDGDWDCDDLVALVRLLVRNRDLLDGMDSGLARLGGWAMRAAHALRRNTRAGSRRNIAAHYDLGNEFFGLFLDQNLMYSSAIFATPTESLELASTRKLDRICEKLDLRADDHLVEIGTGWGGMALHAARTRGCRVTTTTISREQHALASARIAEAGLSDRVQLLLSDYRDLQGTFDKLVSIEMVEAIGHQYLDTYFSTCSRLLRPGGLALVQAITIEDHRYAQALTSVDFIKRHVFPGSFIPCVSALVAAAAQSGPLRLLNLEDFGHSYALTLRHWRDRFAQQREAVRAQGYDERFARMWEFYLCYCEGGFIERAISDVQLLFCTPGQRRADYVPGL